MPGQFARIGLTDEAGEKIWRAYSIVSAPLEPFLEFFLVVLPEGKFSARVAKLTLGQPLLLEKPAQGFLTLDRFKDGCDLWLIGTGTGLAPRCTTLATLGSLATLAQGNVAKATLGSFIII